MANRVEYQMNTREVIHIPLNFSQLLEVTETLLESSRASLLHDGVTVFSAFLGAAGNSIQVEFVDPGYFQASTIFSLSGNVVTLTLQHDGASIIATATSIVSDFTVAPSEVKSLISVSGTDITTVSSKAITSLSGGVSNTIIEIQDVSVIPSVSAQNILMNDPTVNTSGIVNLQIGGISEGKTYQIDVSNNVSSGRVFSSRIFITTYA